LESRSPTGSGARGVFDPKKFKEVNEGGPSG